MSWNEIIKNNKLAEMLANTIKLRQAGTGTPIDLAVGASRMVARLAAGNIVAATPSQIQDLLKIQKHKSVAVGTTFSTTSDTYVAVTGMVVEPTVAGMYFCIFQCSVKNTDDANGVVFLRFNFDGTGDDDTAVGLTNSQFAGEPTLNMTMIKMYEFDGAGEDLIVQTSDFGLGSGTTEIYGRSLTAIKVED